MQRRGLIAVFFSAFLLSGVGIAAPFCAVICGNKQILSVDWNGAFKDYPMCEKHLPTPMGKFLCYPFPSWAAADGAIRAATKRRSSPLKEGDDLLVIQATHGGPGGSAVCNAGEASPDAVMAHLRDYQKRYRVGAILESCYSGDLLMRLITEDAMNPETKLDRLCLTTASAPGRIAFGNGTRTNGQPSSGQDLETWAVRAGFQTSSAAWDSAGVSGYLATQPNANAHQVLVNIKKIFDVTKRCGDEIGEKSLSLCLNPLVSEKLSTKLAKLAGWQTAKLSPADALLFKNGVEKIDSWRSIGKRPQDSGRALSKEDRLRYDCGNFLGSSDLRLYLTGAAEGQSSDFGALADFSFAFEIYNRKGDLSPCYGLLPSDQAPTKTALLEMLLGDELSERVSEIEDIQSEFSTLLGENVTLNQLSPENIVKLLNKNQPSSVCKSEETASKENEVLAAILGSSLDTKLNWEADPRSAYWRSSHYSPFEIMRGFTNASASLPELPAKTDQARRRACREFKF